MLIVNTHTRDVEVQKRRLTEDNVHLIENEIARFHNRKINWSDRKTYVFPLVGAFLCGLYSQWDLYAFPIGFLLGLVPFGILPYFIKGDSRLLKKDLIDGYARIKIAALHIEEIDFRRASGQRGSYMKRYWVGNILIDGIYDRTSTVRFPNLNDGDVLKVEYSPNAQWIFSVEKMDKL